MKTRLQTLYSNLAAAVMTAMSVRLSAPLSRDMRFLAKEVFPLAGVEFQPMAVEGKGEKEVAFDVLLKLADVFEDRSVPADVFNALQDCAADIENDLREKDVHKEEPARLRAFVAYQSGRMHAMAA